MILDFTAHVNLALSSSFVTLVVNKDIPHQISFLGYTISPARRGDKIKVPIPLANVLIKEGYASIDESSIPTITDLNKISWMEARTDELQEIPPNFYYLVRILINKLKEKAIKENDFSAERRLQLVKSLVFDVVKCRLQKILKLVLANPNPSREITNKMSIEEEVLYITLCRIINSWLDYMKNSMEGDSYE